MYRYVNRQGITTTALRLSSKRKKRKAEHLLAYIKRVQQAKANGTYVGASTSADASIEHSCSCMLKKKSGKGCSAIQRCGSLLPCGSGEVITPDLGTQSSGDTEMETQNGASTSFLNSSDIVIKQEIIETEDESMEFADVSFQPPFTNDSLDGQRSETSYSTQSYSPNLNCSMLTSVPDNTGTISTLTQSVKVEPGASSSSCGVSSEQDSALSIDNSKIYDVNSEQNCALPSASSSLNVENSENSTTPTVPSATNVTGDSSNTVQITLGVPFHVDAPSLPHNPTDSNDGQQCNNGHSQSREQSHTNPPFRPRDEFDTFGEFVAMKLRNLNPQLRDYVQKAFADLILRVEAKAFSNRDVTQTRTDNSETNTPLQNNPKVKENIQQIVPYLAENPQLLNSHGSVLRDDTIQQRVPCHIENPSLPPAVNNISSENQPAKSTVTSQIENQNHPALSSTIPESASRNISNQTTLSSTSTSGIQDLNTASNRNNNTVQPTHPTATSYVENMRQLVLNLPGNSSTNNSNQTSVPAQNVPSAVPRVLNPAYSSCAPPPQPMFPLNTRPRDEWDSYAEFVALKCRHLDPKSCLFVQTAFADLIFKAELGKFTNEKSYYSNHTNAFQQNRFPSNVHRSQMNQMSYVPGFVAQPQVTLRPPNCYVGQVPLVTVPTYTIYTNNS